jgi:diguanylate cyclase (GGDEF)-like protein
VKTVEHQCTASLGVAVFRPEDANVDNILRRADDAMYGAKAKGRNQIRFGEEWVN